MGVCRSGWKRSFVLSDNDCVKYEHFGLDARFRDHCFGIGECVFLNCMVNDCGISFRRDLGS